MSTNTYLVECSHEAAIVKQTDTNTYFTNKVGDGIQLNVGDTVAVHSAYIHEIGSGSESIEFDGKNISTQTVPYTDPNVKGAYYPNQHTVEAFVAASKGATLLGIKADSQDKLVWFKSHIYTADNTIPKDDNIIVSNTTTSGFEGIITQNLYLSKALPNAVPVGTVIYVDNTVWHSNTSSLFDTAQIKSYSYMMKDNLVNISYSYYKNADAKNCMMLPRLYFSKRHFGQGLNNPYDKFTRYDKDGKDPDDGVPENFLDFTNTPHDVEPYLSLYRRKHDNSRYKIYTLKNKVPGIASKHFPYNYIGMARIEILNFDRDIGLRDFVPVIDKLELSVASGYNTPANIAADLTAQLQKSPNLETVTRTIPNEKYDKTKDITLSVVIPSPTFKQFKCASVSKYNLTTYTSSILYEANTTEHYNLASRYLESYTNIGVYDPVLFEAGRKLAKSGYIIRKSIPTLARATAEIVISMEYTNANLLLWKTLFDAQATRDDLIFGTNISTSNARFIHMNPGNFIQVTSHTGQSDLHNYLFASLGDDGMRPNSLYGTQGNVYQRTGQSARQYINYGYGSTNTFIEASSSSLTDTNLSYGFAKFTEVEEYDYATLDSNTGVYTAVTKKVKYITFLTNQVGGIQSKINLPITKVFIPPTTGGGALTRAENVTAFKTLYPTIVTAEGVFHSSSP